MRNEMAVKRAILIGLFMLHVGQVCLIEDIALDRLALIGVPAVMIVIVIGGFTDWTRDE